ncbi:sigma-70 family RNA polymerase sigma factor [Paenibacillus mesophilus]|uniref:RNA polymerase sigma factor n=1 Tax=Paenibacillus mesophilus TaxID=2582849 RepID=UPI00110D8B0E|nr:sigma-70 family RNA polymerase sigma factor [Paenibacillus mesophilus]TMV46395.1 sigma-70 family RNA polymerase sigma factor [Paenibacillus mesophilus]
MYDRTNEVTIGMTNETRSGNRHEVVIGSRGPGGVHSVEESGLESLPEERLTEMAREGDRQAFGELVRRNRSDMYGWARSLTQDHHMAEDIVQEALVNAFLHVGRLAEQSRFTPWLVRIVRNQAYMKLRRGGPYAKERPFSGLEPGAGSSFGRAGSPASIGASGGASEDWRDIDRVLFHLTRHSEQMIQQSRDPAAALMRKETLDGIRQLLACLSAREKHIFEAHFFRHVTPQEIAVVLDTSVANVYNSISRARGKLQRERLRLHISMYVKQRRDAGKPKSKLLAPPILYNPKEC